MDLLKTLYDMYQKSEPLIGEFQSRKYFSYEKDYVLAPFLYNYQNTHMIAIIDKEGNVLDLEIKKKLNILPVNLNSMSRGVGITPHPIFDKLKYIANDAFNYSNLNKDTVGCFDAYLLQLKEYICEHFYFEAIYKFYKKNNVIEWLIKEEVLEILNGQLLIDKKESNAKIFSVVDKVLDAVLTFKVLDKDTGELWDVSTNKELFIIHEKVQRKKFESMLNKGICYAKGEEDFIIKKHPKNIRMNGDSPKLISSPSNKTFYTFKGKFSTEHDAYQCSADVSIKAHNMLSYLIQKQGININGRIYLLFHSSIPEPVIFPEELFQFFDNNELEETNQLVDTKEKTAFSLQQHLKGYVEKFPTESGEFYYLVLDSTDGKGRISILDIAVFSNNEYEQLLQNWLYAKNYHLKYRKDIGPSFREIIQHCYFVKGVEVKKNLYKKMFHQLQFSVLRKQQIPKFIQSSLYQNGLKSFVVNKEKKEDFLWLLGSVLNYNQKLKGENELKKNRSYYFGELLAIAERIENLTYTEETKRVTNAERLTSMIAQRPSQTWADLYKKLNPYLQRLQNKNIGSFIYLRKEIDNIMELLAECNGFNNQPLNEDFLMGYSLRRKSFYKKREVNEKILAVDTKESEEK